MRRAARELALKTTFQVDVGKQPLSDVLDGFLEELRENATGRILKVASTTGNSLLEGAAPSDETVSTQSKRQLKGIARALSGELDTLAQSAAALVRDAVSEFGHFSLERALAAFDAESRATVQRLKSQASRPTLYTEHAKHLLETAKGALPLIRQHLELQLPFAINAGQYGVGLVRGIIEKRDEIDKRVSTLASGWALERLAAVDRNILRLAAYELLYMNEPVGAVINEAVELAKKFSTDESGRFVNGILGSLAAEGGSSRVEAKPSPDQAGILSQQ